jgi:polyisoprenoid-binding protein YceI
MKSRMFTLAVVALGVSVAFPAFAQTTRYDSKPGALKVRIEGTSNMHAWQVQGKLIGGYIEVGSGFPTEPGKAAAPGKVDAKVEAFIPVRSLTSVKADGTPYNSAMDDIMWDKLKAGEHPRIIYKLNELVLKEPAKAKDQPYIFDAKGELAVAGETSQISMPVNVTPQPDGSIKITGEVEVKMTDFKIEPPAPKIAMGMITTGDPVKLIFEWQVAQRKK